MINEFQNITDIFVPDSLSVDDSNHSEYYDIQTNFIRHLYIKINILDQENKIVNEVSGKAIDGSYNINSESTVRRTCNLTFNLENGYLPNENSPFWINKKFQLYIGLKHINFDKIYWFNKGVYLINNPEISVSIANNTISISGLDKMALFNGDISGQLQVNTLAEAKDGVTKRDVIKALMVANNESEDKIFIFNPHTINNKIMDEQIPYNIESNIGDTVTTVLDKIIELLANYEYYYDINGNFIFKPKPMNSNYKDYFIVWDFEKYNNLIISVNRNIDYSNVKNRVTIWGGIHEDGYQPSYILKLEDSNDFYISPFTATNLGEKYYRDYVEQCDDYVDTILNFDVSVGNYYPYNSCVEFLGKYYLCINPNGVESDNDNTPDWDLINWEYICNSDDSSDIAKNMQKIHAYSIALCEQKANEILFHHHLASETISITCVPIYSLDVNTVIYINDELSGAKGYYVVTEISCQLNANGTMNITANKLYD